MGEWATSNFRLVYDGVDDEDTTSFTVDTRCGFWAVVTNPLRRQFTVNVVWG